MIYNQWYAILPSRAVKTNELLSVKRLNRELALFRNSNGELGCVEDQCSHRGAALSQGKLQGECLQCPFHGLEFNSQGRCTFVPANGKAFTEDLSRFNVKSYTVRESNGIIYLWHGEHAQQSDVLPFFDGDIDASYVYSEIEDHWQAHYSRCIENQLDVIHLPFVHHNTIGRGNKTLVNGPKIEFIPGGIITSANNETDIGQKPKAADECVIKSTYLKFLFPNIWMNHISESTKVIIYFAPVDDENTILYMRFYCRSTRLRPVNALIAWFGKFGNRLIERQDKRVVITQKPKASSFISKENLLSGDGPVIQYRRIREELKNR